MSARGRHIAIGLVATALAVVLLSGAAQAQGGARPGPQVDGAPREPALRAGESAPPTPPPPEAVARLRDIRGPVPFAPPWRWIDYVVVVALALVLLGIALALAGMHRARPPAAAIAEHVPDAAEAALRELDELEMQGLYPAPGHEPHVRLASRIPAIMKAFLDARFVARSEYLTTFETYGALLSAGDGTLAREVALLLALCDRVKFAGVERFADDPIGAARDVVGRTAAEVTAQRLGGGVAR